MVIVKRRNGVRALPRFRFGQRWRRLVCEWPLLIALILCVGKPTAGEADPLPLTKSFSIDSRGQTLWLVNPNGERFFSFGVCCVNQGIPHSEWHAANPGYAAWQNYPDSNAWAVATLGRLKSWGFTTIGGWSDFQTLGATRDPGWAFAPVLHIGATAGAPWWDMWDPRVIKRLDQIARDSILPFRNDPRVIGYYTDNEIGWWNGILLKMTFEQAPTSGQRQRLIHLLRDTYRDDWSALMRDFEAAPLLESWDELEQHGQLFLRPGGDGIRVARQFLGLLADRYYSLIHELVRKYHPGALILGDRFPSFYYPEVVRACVPYVDAVSCNLNPVWNDGTFPRYYLDTLHALSGKPLMIGEFYLCAQDNRSGNKNNHGLYPVVATQKERASAFRNTVLQILAAPYVIGADWFQYYDQPRHGRFDGENFNFGLVDIFDRPYETLTSVAARLDPTRIKAQPLRALPDATQGVPPAPREPLAFFSPTLALKNWDRKRGFVKPVSEYPLADLYVCWSRKAIYFGLCAQDVVEDTFYRGKTVLTNDRAEWTVSIKGRSTPIRGRIGSGMEPIFDEPSVKVVNVSGINGMVRNIAALEVPAKLFGKERFIAGDAVELNNVDLADTLPGVPGRLELGSATKRKVSPQWVRPRPGGRLGHVVFRASGVSSARTAAPFLNRLGDHSAIAIARGDGTSDAGRSAPECHVSRRIIESRGF